MRLFPFPPHLERMPKKLLRSLLQRGGLWHAYLDPWRKSVEAAVLEGRTLKVLEAGEEGWREREEYEMESGREWRNLSAQRDREGFLWLCLWDGERSCWILGEEGTSLKLEGGPGVLVSLRHQEEVVLLQIGKEGLEARSSRDGFRSVRFSLPLRGQMREPRVLSAWEEGARLRVWVSYLWDGGEHLVRLDLPLEEVRLEPESRLEVDQVEPPQRSELREGTRTREVGKNQAVRYKVSPPRGGRLGSSPQREEGGERMFAEASPPERALLITSTLRIRKAGTGIWVEVETPNGVFLSD